MEHSLGPPQDTKSLRSCFGNRAKMLLKSHLGIECHSQYFKIISHIFINDILKINSLPEIATSTTIYEDDVQLLLSSTPNNLEQ